MKIKKIMEEKNQYSVEKINFDGKDHKYNLSSLRSQTLLWVMYTSLIIVARHRKVLRWQALSFITISFN